MSENQNQITHECGGTSSCGTLGLPGGPYVSDGECSACGAPALRLRNPHPAPCSYLGCDEDAQRDGHCERHHRNKVAA